MCLEIRTGFATGNAGGIDGTCWVSTTNSSSQVSCLCFLACICDLTVQDCAAMPWSKARAPTFPSASTDYGVCCSPRDTGTVRRVAYFGALDLHILHLRQHHAFSFREALIRMNVPRISGVERMELSCE